MGKNYDGGGEAAIITAQEFAKIRKCIELQKYKLLVDIGWYTGERIGAIIQLTILDVYNADGTPKDEITFKASTRKRSPNGVAKTRQVPIHPSLTESLLCFTPDESSPWLFPGRDNSKNMSRRNAALILESAVQKAGLSTKGISTHSFRRSFITRLNKNGIDAFTIKSVTGHKNIQNVQRYIVTDHDQIKNAIATL